MRILLLSVGILRLCSRPCENFIREEVCHNAVNVTEYPRDSRRVSRAGSLHLQRAT